MPGTTLKLNKHKNNIPAPIPIPIEEFIRGSSYVPNSLHLAQNFSTRSNNTLEKNPLHSPYVPLSNKRTKPYKFRRN